MMPFAALHQNKQTHLPQVVLCHDMPVEFISIMSLVASYSFQKPTCSPSRWLNAPSEHPQMTKHLPAAPC